MLSCVMLAENGLSGRSVAYQLVKQRFIEDLEEGEGVRAGGNDASCAEKNKQEAYRVEAG